MPNINIPLTSLGTEVKTLLPDGTEYMTVTGLQNSIGEKKRYTWKFSTAYNMESVNIWAKIAIYQQGVLNAAPATIKVPVDHAFTFPIGLTPGKYPMALLVPVGVNINVNNNLQCYIDIISSTHWNLVIEFYQIYDETTYQSQGNQDNHKKLLCDIKNAPVDLVLGPAKTCYNSNISNFCISLRLEKDGQVHPEAYPDVFPYTDNGNPFTGGTWVAGFFNRNANNNPPYFTVPQFLLTRSTLPVTNFSASFKTDVDFRITSPSIVTKVLMWIIRTDKFDNTTDMVSNYEANFEDIISSNANIGAAGNKFSTPVTNITALGAGVYKVAFSIDGANLFNGGKYRLIAIVYDKDTGAGFVNSFISEEYVVNGLPCYDGNGFDVRAVLDDYNKQFSGNNLQCCIEERMRSKVKLDFAFNKWKDDIQARLGLTVPNDIRYYLTGVKCEILEEYTHPVLGSVVNIYDSKTSNRYGANLYSAQSGMTLNFGNNWSEFQYEWRNRFENGTLCMQTLINGANTIPQLGTQYWGGKNLTVRWTLLFFYHDYSSPFYDEVVINQKIRVKDYGEMQVAYFDNEENEFGPLKNICNDEPVCFGGILQNPSLTDRKLITNIYPLGSSVNSLEEAEVWVGGQLPQLTTDKIVNQDEDFSVIDSETAALFCVDGSKLLVNSQYVISALAKKYYERRGRIIESGEPRIIENQDRRVIEP